MFKEFKIILIGDEGLVGSYYGTYLGFASGLSRTSFQPSSESFYSPLEVGNMEGCSLTSIDYVKLRQHC